MAQIMANARVVTTYATDSENCLTFPIPSADSRRFLVIIISWITFSFHLSQIGDLESGVAASKDAVEKDIEKVRSFIAPCKSA